MSLGDVEQIVNCSHYSKHRAEVLRPLMFQIRIWNGKFLLAWYFDGLQQTETDQKKADLVMRSTCLLTSCNPTSEINTVAGNQLTRSKDNIASSTPYPSSPITVPIAWKVKGFTWKVISTWHEWWVYHYRAIITPIAIHINKINWQWIWISENISNKI